MATEDFDVEDYLKPTDVSTLPRRRGRKPSTFYARLVDAFLSAEKGAMEVDVTRIGRKPLSVRSGLAKAIKSGGMRTR